jgi:hypothetical protein
LHITRKLAGKTLRQQALFGIVLLLAIIVFRGRSLFTPFSDPTPGLYLHIATAWLKGQIPYTTTWDYRPPGYFALYALSIRIFGAALSRDALAIASLAATAVAVSLIAARIDVAQKRVVGYFAATFFVLLSPVNDGVAGVAELQISAFVAWAIYLALVRPDAIAWTALGGILTGLAIQCKLSAIPLSIVPMLLVATRSARAINALIAFAAGFCVPILIDVAVYARFQQLQNLWTSNIGSTIRRAQDNTGGNEFARNRSNFAKQLFALAPQVEFACFALTKRVNSSRLATVGWTLAALLSIVVAGEYYERQFVLLSGPVAILGAIGFLELTERIRSKGVRQWVYAVVILTSFALHDYFETNQTLAYTLHRIVLRDSRWRLDQSAELYSDLSCLPKGDNTLYLIEQNPYLYDLLDEPSPTKYAYSDHLLDPRLSRMADIDGKTELARILDHTPDYVVVSGLTDFRYAADRVTLIRHVLTERYTRAYASPQFSIYESNGEKRYQTRLPCESATPAASL